MSLLGFVRNGNTVVLQGDLEAIKEVPHRAWNTRGKEWVAPLTPLVVECLLRHGSDLRLALEKLMRRTDYAFQFKTSPRKHQEEAFAIGLKHPFFAALHDPGLGKTKLMIDDARASGLESYAVICPNSIKSNWADELGIHCTGDPDIFVYSPEKKVLAERWIKKGGANRWFIIASESLSSGAGRKYLESFLRSAPCDLILDESCWFSNYKAARTKVLLELGPLAERRRIGTGTHITKGIQEAWSQLQFLSPSILRMDFFAFRNRFCVMGELEVWRPEDPAILARDPSAPPSRKVKIRKILGTKDEHLFVDLIAPYVHMGRKETCLDLPPKTYHVRRIEPSPEQKRLYRELKSEGLSEVGDRSISALNVLVRDLRLQQITGGFVCLTPPKLEVEELGFDCLPTELPEPETVAIEGPNPKVEELLNVIQEFPGKTIIWFRFLAEIEAVKAVLENYVVFSGATSPEERTIARQRFQNDPEVRFFLGQIQTGGVGITLTAANTTIYFSNDWSARRRIQSEDRNHRIGTVGTVNYIDLILDGDYVDGKILKAVKKGQDYHAEISQRIEEATR